MGVTAITPKHKKNHTMFYSMILIYMAYAPVCCKLTGVFLSLTPIDVNLMLS
jgi:hypothetical protein